MGHKVVLVFMTVTLILSSTHALADQSSHRKAADGLLQSMKINQTMIETVDKMVDIEIQKNPQISLFKDIMRAFFAKHMTGDKLTGFMTTLYMETFNEKELKEMTAFYKTPTGQKAIEKMPLLSQQGAIWGQKQVSENIEELKSMIAQEAKRLEQLKKSAPE